MLLAGRMQEAAADMLLQLEYTAGGCVLSAHVSVVASLHQHTLPCYCNHLSALYACSSAG